MTFDIADTTLLAMSAKYISLRTYVKISGLKFSDKV